MKKIKPKYFILDVDGVITNGQMTYDKYGKKYKVFGQDDHDSLKVIKKYVKVYFVSGDKIGFKISKKRVEDMGFKIKYLPVEIREKWLNKNFCLNHVCKSANYVTKKKPAQRAVAEAVIHLLKKIYGINFLEIKNFKF